MVGYVFSYTPLRIVNLVYIKTPARRIEVIWHSAFRLPYIYMKVIMTVTSRHTLLWSKFLKQEFYLKKSVRMRFFSTSINSFELTSIAIINNIICIVKSPCGLFFKQMLDFHIFISKYRLII